MPYMRGPAAKATDLSWDAFPEPTPEVQNWQPDPDSIPVGSILDHRLNKDPMAERLKMALKRHTHSGLAASNLSMSTGSSSSATSTANWTARTGIGNWPIPVPRATGISRTLAPTGRDGATSCRFAHPEAPKLTGAASAMLLAVPTSSDTANAAPRFTDSSKGTMESLSVQPPVRRPHTPTASIISQESASPPKTPTPAWALSLAHLLGDSPPKLAPLVLPTPVQNRSPKASSVSKPPHLRKIVKVPSPTAVYVGTFNHQPDNVNETDPLVVKPEQIRANLNHESANAASKDQTTQQHTAGPAHNSSKVDSRSTNLGERLQLQKTLLERFIPEDPDLPAEDHQRHLNSRLISLMEDDMDIQKRTTRKELNDMSDMELDSHLIKTRSAHKLWWEGEQRIRKQGGIHLKTASAGLQQQEQQQFGKTKTPSEGRFGDSNFSLL